MRWWELYYKMAVALVNENRSVWKKFIEATKVLKLSFIRPKRESEIALYTLWQLLSNKEDSEMNSISSFDYVTKESCERYAHADRVFSCPRSFTSEQSYS